MLTSLIGIIASSGGAGGAAGTFESIASATGTGSSGTITFSSIPSGYVSLQVRAIVRNAAAGNDFDYFLMRVNGDTGANYAYHALTGTGTTPTAFAGASQTSGIGGVMALNGTTSNIVSSNIIDIHDYASTTRNKTIRGFSGVDFNSATPAGIAMLSSSAWFNTSAVTSLSFISSSNFTTQTSFALYGIKGA
jgi:hypothetical protein